MAGDNDDTGVNGGDGHGGNKETRPSPPNTVPDEELDEKFLGAMYALKREREQATVVDTDGNMALIWLGEYHLYEYSERWDDPKTQMYILVDQDIAGSDPHWVMMAPAVSVDGNEPGVIDCRNTYPDDNDNHQDKVQMVLDVAEVEDAIAFSWRWSHMNRQPERARDLADAHTLIEHLLRLDESRGPT